MGWKERLQERIERNTVKSELAWTDKNGRQHTEMVYLKRSRIPILGDWTRIYPPIDENGNVKWLNLIFGGYRNLIKLIVVMLIVGMVLYQFKIVFTYIEYLRNLPCVKTCLETMKNVPTINPFF